jgi:UDP-N-acetylmuramoyl-tripeptide--D-alanyl-D-alanine ligase
MAHMFEDLPHEMCGGYAADSEAMVAMLVDQLRDGDIVLVKGSRSMKMEKVVQWIERN